MAKKIKPINDNSMNTSLLNFEESMLKTFFKIGILYAREGQTTEEEMFSNEHGSAAFDEFLELMGDKINLQNFTGFNGGLDTKSDQTGKETIYTKWMNKEILFHVSTLLPYSHTSPQQLERKRHLGNDIVIFIFYEGNDTINPEVIRSSFIHIIFIIQPIKYKKDTYYRFSCATRNTIPKYVPYLPEPPIFQKEELKDVLLCKAINGEKKCL